MSGAGWQKFVLLAVLTFLLAAPVWADGMPSSGPAPYTDYGHFLGEFQSAGALKFYENTEELLRLAQFETALMRYRFLKGQIQRRVDYRGLVPMVDYRLRFLKKQLHLTNRDIAAIPPRRARIPGTKPPAPKDAKKDAAAKPKTPATAAKDKNKDKPVLTIPGQAPAVNLITRPTAPSATPGATTAPTPPGPQKLPDVVTTTPESKEQKADAAQEKQEQKKALGVWDKLKLRLNLFN